MTSARPSLARRLRHLVEAGLFFTLMTLFRVLGLDAASALGGALGRHVFSRTPLDRTARVNLAAAFPDKSEAERAAIRKRMWDNLGRTVAEYPHLGKLSIYGPQARVIAVNLAPTAQAQAQAQGQGMMFLSAHLANWEIMPATGDEMGFVGATVVRPPNNPHVARYVARQRALLGPKDHIGKQSGARRIFALLRGGKSVYMLVDQKNNEGVAVPFFGRVAMTNPVPAALSLKLGAHLFLVRNRRTRGARFEVTIMPGPDFTPSGNSARDILALTAAITARIEQIIREDPAAWLWIHNRWPRTTQAG